MLNLYGTYIASISFAQWYNIVVINPGVLLLPTELIFGLFFFSEILTFFLPPPPPLAFFYDASFIRKFIVKTPNSPKLQRVADSLPPRMPVHPQRYILQQIASGKPLENVYGRRIRWRVVWEQEKQKSIGYTLIALRYLDYTKIHHFFTLLIMLYI